MSIFFDLKHPDACGEVGIMLQDKKFQIKKKLFSDFLCQNSCIKKLLLAYSFFFLAKILNGVEFT